MNNYFSKIFFSLTVITGFIFISFNLKSADFKELTVRGGLPSFTGKALKGDTLKVAYLGGSITEQPGWRVYSLDWFREQFPQSTFIEINAAIGGTGSDFGAFRLKKHVLEFKPDLLFVEFAVNDDGKDRENIERSMEGIIRQCKSFNSEIDICLIYTIKQNFLEIMAQGEQPPSIEAMEQVAQHYNLPSINFGIDVATQIKAGNLIMMANEIEKDEKKVFSSDGVHPFLETGHRIYHQAFVRSFKSIIAKNYSAKSNDRLPQPMKSDSYSEASLLNFEELPVQPGWQKITLTEDSKINRVNKLVKSAVLSEIPEASINFSFTGSAVGACDLMGPGAGRVIVKIDGETIDTLIRFDKYSTYWRANYFLIDNLKDTTHFVSLIQYEEPFDKTAILDPTQNSKAGEVEYQTFKWYPCEFLINGQINNK